jgi:FtsZ-binding cell division protein ZapB
MEKGIVIGFLISLAIIISLGLFFNLSNKNLYLGQISSSLREFGKLNYEIQNLKKEISSLKEEFEKEKKERGTLNSEIQNSKKEISSLKEEIEKWKKESKEAKEKIKKPKEIAICQKKENDSPRHRVIFNEICWMGDEESPANEWIEIKNVSKDEIDLSGWQISNKNQKLKIIFEEGTKILPNEILLLKRGDDFSGAIKNSAEALFLFDKNCNLEDEVFATSSWPAGDNFSKRTAERKEDLSWQTSLDPGGTPGKENSPGFVEIEKEEEKEPKISLDFPKEIFANQEFKVSLSVSDLENETYDIKISILKISDESEQKRTISEISLTGEEWQNSYKYLSKVFSGTSFSGDFKLRISQKYQDFKGEAEILAKVRQSDNKKVVAEFKDKILVKEREKISETIPSESPPIAQVTTSTKSTFETIPLTVATKILISEVCAGLDRAENEFIELYNPNDFPVLISDQYFKLKLVDSSNKITTKRINWINNLIPPKGYFLFVGGEISMEPDATFSSQLTYVSGVIITDSQDNIIDKVAWGTNDKPPPSNAVEGEGIILESGLKTGQSLERINFQDTDNNAKDFQLQLTPSPQNSKTQ